MVINKECEYSNHQSSLIPQEQDGLTQQFLQRMQLVDQGLQKTDVDTLKNEDIWSISRDEGMFVTKGNIERFVPRVNGLKIIIPESTTLNSTGRGVNTYSRGQVRALFGMLAVIDIEFRKAEEIDIGIVVLRTRELLEDTEAKQLLHDPESFEPTDIVISNPFNDRKNIPKGDMSVYEKSMTISSVSEGDVLFQKDPDVHDDIDVFVEGKQEVFANDPKYQDYLTSFVKVLQGNDKDEFFITDTTARLNIQIFFKRNSGYLRTFATKLTLNEVLIPNYLKNSESDVRKEMQAFTREQMMAFAALYYAMQNEGVKSMNTISQQSLVNTALRAKEALGNESTISHVITVPIFSDAVRQNEKEVPKAKGVPVDSDIPLRVQRMIPKIEEEEHEFLQSFDTERLRAFFNEYKGVSANAFLTFSNFGEHGAVLIRVIETNAGFVTNNFDKLESDIKGIIQQRLLWSIAANIKALDHKKFSSIDELYNFVKTSIEAKNKRTKNTDDM